MPAPITIEFGPFEPDSAHVNSMLLNTARSVYPAKNGYVFMPSAVARSSGLSPFFAAPRGAAVIQTSGSGGYSFYGGDADTLKRIDSSALLTTNTLNTGLTGPNAGELWRFAKFDNYLIIVNPNAAPRVVDWTAAPGATSVLGGSPPTATGVFTIGDFVFLTGLSTNKRKLRWSGIGNHESWTVGTDLSDGQEFPDGGDVLGIAGDTTGYVIQQNAIRRFQFLPGDTDTVFQFSKIDGIPGCIGPYSWASAAQTVFYYSEEGFCAIGPAGFRRIGAHRVDYYFKSELLPSTTTVQALADPCGPRIFFTHVSGALIYDYELDRWSETAYLPSGWIDALDGTGGGGIGAIESSVIKTLSAAFGGGGTFETCVLEIFQSGPNAGKRALITAVRPIVEGGGTPAITIRSQEKLSGDVTTKSSSTEESNGRVSIFASGAYHQITTEISGSASYFKGIQVWAQPDGEA